MTDIDITATTAGSFDLGGDLKVARMGYGAMQLAGPGVYGQPEDPEAARDVLRRAVELGVDHIDTSDFYGPYVTNELIREALHPYPENLVLVTKVGARRGPDKSWIPALEPGELRQAVHDNLRRLGVERMDGVNLRLGGFIGPEEGPLEQQFTTLLELQAQGLIRHIGLSNVTLDQLRTAQRLGRVACVQNYYNLVHRVDEEMVDACADEGIAYVPFFPLGGFSPIQSERLNTLAQRLGATPMQLALAWLLHRSPSILLIPGTANKQHLEENVAAAGLHLSEEDRAELDAIATA
jgi:pyridoxine 4-dehydrogenase